MAEPGEFRMNYYPATPARIYIANASGNWRYRNYSGQAAKTGSEPSGSTIWIEEYSGIPYFCTHHATDGSKKLYWAPDGLYSTGTGVLGQVGWGWANNYIYLHNSTNGWYYFSTAPV